MDQCVPIFWRIPMNCGDSLEKDRTTHCNNKGFPITVDGSGEKSEGAEMGEDPVAGILLETSDNENTPRDASGLPTENAKIVKMMGGMMLNLEEL